MEIEGLVVHFGKLQEESCHHRVHGFSRLHGDWLMDPPGKFTKNWDVTSYMGNIMENFPEILWEI